MKKILLIFIAGVSSLSTAFATGVTGETLVCPGNNEYAYDGYFDKTKWRVNGVLKPALADLGTVTINITQNSYIQVEIIEYEGSTPHTRYEDTYVYVKTPGQISGPDFVCNGGTVTLAPVNQNGSSFTLQSSPYGANTWTTFTNGSTITQKTSFRIILNDCSALSSPVITTDIYSLTAAATASADQDLWDGQPGLYVTATSPTSNGFCYDTQWQSNSGAGWSNISGATLNDVNPGILNATIAYRVISTFRCNSSVTYTSNVVTKTVHALPVITSDAPWIALNQSVTLTCSSGFSTYTWRNSANSIIGTSQQLVTNSVGTYTVTVTSSGLTASTSFTLFSQFNGVNENYVVSTSVLKDNITDPEIVPTLAIGEISQQVGIFDGLGRPSQSINVQSTPLKKDLVTVVEYDVFGREAKKYLPYASSDNSGRPKSDPTGIATTYTSSPHYLTFTNGTSDKIADDAQPYAQTIFEPSPANRVVKQGSPGAAWQPNASLPYDLNDHSIKKAYVRNSSSEVIQFTYDLSTRLVTNSGFYSANKLYANKTYDEANNDVIEYVDMQGHTVCKKVKVSGNTYASTYYLYDDFGNLVVVLPPEAVKSMAPTN